MVLKASGQKDQSRRVRFASVCFSLLHLQTLVKNNVVEVATDVGKSIEQDTHRGQFSCWWQAEGPRSYNLKEGICCHCAVFFLCWKKDVCYMPISLKDVATGQSILQGCEVSSYWQPLQSQPRGCSWNSLCCEIRTCLVATCDVQAQSEKR